MTALARSINELTIVTHVIRTSTEELVLPLVSWVALWFGLYRWLLVTVSGDRTGQRTIERRSQ